MSSIYQSQQLILRPFSRPSMQPPERKLWKLAIQDELNSLRDKHTWSASEMLRKNKPVGAHKALPAHVFLKIERDSNGHPVCFKARVVAGGHLQVKGRDFEEVYAPVVDFGLVRLMIVIILHKGWHTRYVDVKSAFLNGDIDRETYVTHPVNVSQSLKIDKLYLLHKALYGLHQAPLAWFKKLLETSVDMFGYKQLAVMVQCFYERLQHQLLLSLSTWMT
jgi:hypothetical protein